MTRRKEMISGSRKQASQHDPEGKMISRSRKQASQHDPEGENDFWVKEGSELS